MFAHREWPLRHLMTRLKSTSGCGAPQPVSRYCCRLTRKQAQPMLTVA
jgi:hypothetical protein